jgi:hypothetical protein
MRQDNHILFAPRHAARATTILGKSLTKDVFLAVHASLLAKPLQAR